LGYEKVVHDNEHKIIGLVNHEKVVHDNEHKINPEMAHAFSPFCTKHDVLKTNSRTQQHQIITLLPPSRRVSTVGAAPRSGRRLRSPESFRPPCFSTISTIHRRTMTSPSSSGGVTASGPPGDPAAAAYRPRRHRRRRSRGCYGASCCVGTHRMTREQENRPTLRRRTIGASTASTNHDWASPRWSV